MKKMIVFLFISALISTYCSVFNVFASEMNTYTPYQLTAKPIPQDDTHPNGSSTLTFRIDNLPRSSNSIHTSVIIDMKIGDKDWFSQNELTSDECLDNYQISPGVFSYEQLYTQDTNWDGVRPISYRIYVKQYDNTWTGIGHTTYSNIATLGLKSSPWAVSELQQAEELGLMPNILKGADMTKPITREEFAELAVLLYEKSTGKASTCFSPNPFSDTNNTQILKAYQLGITSGTTSKTFSPNTLINREQCATMLFKCMKAIKPDGDYSISGAKDFPDQKFISDWAVESTKYMNKIGIISGDAAGNFMPKATTTAQQSIGYGMATREQAVALTVRSYKKLN